MSQHLAGVSGVVEILLKHATNDELSNDAKQNAAICLAKLATADKRYCDTNIAVFLNNTDCAYSRHPGNRTTLCSSTERNRESSTATGHYFPAPLCSQLQITHKTSINTADRH